jgi:hypothetical protein
MACEPSTNKRSGAQERRETQTLTKNKKDPILEKKIKKNNFGPRGARPHSLPKRP